MINDYLDQLAEWEVPGPPAEFDRKLHERVNRYLAAQHVLHLAVGAVPWAALHFARAVLAAVTFSITGHYGDRPKDKKREPL